MLPKSNPLSALKNNTRKNLRKIDEVNITSVLPSRTHKYCPCMPSSEKTKEHAEVRTDAPIKQLLQLCEGQKI